MPSRSGLSPSSNACSMSTPSRHDPNGDDCLCREDIARSRHVRLASSRLGRCVSDLLCVACESPAAVRVKAIELGRSLRKAQELRRLLATGRTMRCVARSIPLSVAQRGQLFRSLVATRGLDRLGCRRFGGRWGRRRTIDWCLAVGAGELGVRPVRVAFHVDGEFGAAALAVGSE